MKRTLTPDRAASRASPSSTKNRAALTNPANKKHEPDFHDAVGCDTPRPTATRA